MRVVLVLTVYLLFTPTIALGQSSSTKQTDVCAQQMNDIAETLRQIQASVSRVSEQFRLQSQVGALAALDGDISTLSTELQRSLEARTPLNAALARYRAMTSTGKQLPAVELSDQAAHQEALDQLDRRIEEIRQTLSARRVQLAALEKILGDLMPVRK